MAIILPDLPYAYDALEPYIDAETMHLHHDKHTTKHVNNAPCFWKQLRNISHVADVDSILLISIICQASLSIMVDIWTMLFSGIDDSWVLQHLR